MRTRSEFSLRTVLPAAALTAVAIAGCSTGSSHSKPAQPEPRIGSLGPTQPRPFAPSPPAPGRTLRRECIGGLRDWGVVTLDQAQVTQVLKGVRLSGVVDQLTHGRAFNQGTQALAVEFPRGERDLSRAITISRDIATMIGYHGGIEVVHETAVPDNEVIARTGIRCEIAPLPTPSGSGEAV